MGTSRRRITVEAKGEILELKNTINATLDQLRSFAAEVTRVAAREVGTQGMLGAQADVKGVSGTWKNLTDNVNLLAGNLTDQVRNIALVTTAVANGDLSKKITVEVKGEILELKNTVNAMVDRLQMFAAEVTRVAKEVGTEGRLGGQADVKGVSGTWRNLTDNVNVMAANLTTQVRGIAKVVTAVAGGDLSQKFVVEAKGEIAALADTINNMTDFLLRTFAAQVTTVAREVGIEGKLGGQARVPGVSGTWRELTDNVNLLAGNLTNQVRNIALVTTAVANGDLSQKITVDAKGEILELKNTINAMVDQSELVRGRGDSRRERGRYRGKTWWSGGCERRLGHVEGPDRQRELHGGQPDKPGARHREGRDRGRKRGSLAKVRRGGQGRDRGPCRHDQQHDGHPARLRRAGHHRRPRGRDRRKAGRTGQGARGGRHLARPDRQRESSGRKPDEPGAKHRSRYHCGRKRRPLTKDYG